MNSRERIRKILLHKKVEEPDRVPIDSGGLIVTSITKNASIELKSYLGLEIEEVKIFDHVQQHAALLRT